MVMRRFVQAVLRRPTQVGYIERIAWIEEGVERKGVFKVYPNIIRLEDDKHNVTYEER